MSRRALIVGAGIVGLACAHRLARTGWSVVVLAPDAAETASSVAAGMLAPVAEAATDSASPPYPVMQEALERWTAFARDVGAPDALVRSGTRWVGPFDTAERFRTEAGRLGAEVRFEPSAPGEEVAAFAPEDARVDVGRMAESLAERLEKAGVQRRVAQAARLEADSVATTDGETLEADLVVAAAGWGARGLVPEAGSLSPVRGQLVQFAPTPGCGDGPMVRTPEGYLCPSPRGIAAGATMDLGREDVTPDPEVARRHAALARRLRPELEAVAYEARVGVRATTPDGRPLVGRGRDGVVLATGMRRNGWLLAPMVADTVARLAAGQAPEPWAEAWAPTRPFSPTARN